MSGTDGFNRNRVLSAFSGTVVRLSELDPEDIVSFISKAKPDLSKRLKQAESEIDAALSSKDAAGAHRSLYYFEQMYRDTFDSFAKKEKKP